ncbi:uncharacterized protein LOC113501810 isoform X2 [Trichoplusia ni]|uniref:Uncharacterized protein LOC113501810 isoform X2 n=1 Tax=Trichoplusia ni TaxID=7111 RepID=A0A7E5WDW8_TRINI|nr:uncharacterized protein LOC113501810 isoform X2 [Trichoplusia ni]
MVRDVPTLILLLLLVELATGFVFKDRANFSSEEEGKNEVIPGFRRQGKKNSPSTSSEGNRKGSSGGGAASAESLGQEFSGATSTDTDEKKRTKKERAPKSTEERKGWRKWHRKCTQCPADMRKKWRDPSIAWICGAYQRARRSFKSPCMMYLRNCQDGTMFVKIADHRCPNASGQVLPHGEHFFYDYEVVLTDDDAKSDDAEASTAEKSESSSWDASRIRKIPPPPAEI